MPRWNILLVIVQGNWQGFKGDHWIGSLCRKNKASATTVPFLSWTCASRTGFLHLRHWREQSVGTWPPASTCYDFTPGSTPKLLCSSAAPLSQHTERNLHLLPHIALDFIPLPCRQLQRQASGNSWQLADASPSKWQLLLKCFKGLWSPSGKLVVLSFPTNTVKES